jgi:hypothetical protein
VTIFRFLFILSISCSFLACESGHHQKPIDLNEVRAHAQKQAHKTPTQKTDSSAFFSKQYANDSVSLKLASLQPDSSLKHQLLDRFTKQHYHFLIRDSSKQTFHHSYWLFKDSSQTLNALYNWLDDFSERHLSLKLGSRIPLGPNYQWIFVSTHRIDLFESKQRYPTTTWLKWLQGNEASYTLYYLIRANPGKNCSWWQFANRQFIPYETR